MAGPLSTYSTYVLYDQTVTSSGSSQVYSGYNSQEVSLIVNITGSVTGSITFTISEIDAGDLQTQIGATSTGATITSTGTQVITLPVTVTGCLQVSWVVSGGSPSINNIYATLVDKMTAPNLYDADGNGPVAVKPSGTAATTSDASLVVSISPNTPITVNATSDGYVTTSSPSYTNDTTQPLSLTTSGALRTDGSATTQPVSAVSLPLPTGAATASNQTTLGTQTTEINDGTHTATIKAASTAAIATDTALVVAISPNNTPVLPSGAATSANQTNGNQQTQIVEGGNVATVTAASALKVDGSAVTQPVSGTVTSNQGATAWVDNITQFGGVPLSTGTGASGTGIPRVTVSNDSNILATQSGTWTTTVTQATAANLNAAVVGTTAAGSGASSGLVTIQGNASGTPVPVTGTLTASTDGYVTTSAPTYANNTSQALSLTTTGLLRIDGVYPVNATTPTTDAAFVAGAVTTAAPTYATGQMSALSLNTSGGLRVDGSGVTQPVSGTVTANQGTSPWVSNITQFGSSNVVTGTGASGAGIPRVTVSNDSNVLATQSGTWTVQPGNTANTTPWLATINQGGNSATVTASNALKVDGSAVTQPVSGTVTANAGTGSFTVAQATAANLNATVTANGNFNNASVGSTATAPPSSATYAGALVTTAAQSGLTNNDMYPLNMSATGLLRIDGSNVTQPVSGTVTANAGTGSFTVAQATASNLNATVTGTVAATQSGTWTVQPGNTANTTPWLSTINQGGNSAAVKAASTAAVATDPSLVTAFSPNSPLPTGTNTIGVINQGTAATLANAWSIKITDATNGPAAVKAASTAAVATDPALVVAISPNNSLSIATADVSATGALGALNAAVSVTHPGLMSIGMQLAAGTLVGTIIPEVSFDGGTTWNATYFNSPTGNIVSSVVFGSANTATAETIVGVGGAGMTRVRVSAYTSGTANITVRASDINDPSLLSGGTAGSALPPIVQQVGGSVTTASPSYSNSTVNALSLNTAGGLRVDGSAVTQPVSGTVTANAGTGNFTVVQATASNLNATVTGTVAATQSGTWTVQPGNTANTTPWLATINQGGNSATVTASNALKVDGSAVTQPVSGTVTANAGTGSFTVAQATAANLNATVVQGTSPWVDNITQFGGTNISTGTGASGTGIPRVTVSNDSNILATQSGTWTVQPGNTANTTPWLATVNQGGNSAAVKAASTAAVATDPALVVAVSPNNTVSTLSPDVTATGALGALNASVQITLAGSQSVGFQLAAGTLVGTIVAQVSFDGGTTWNSTYIDPSSGNIVSTIVFASSNAATAGTVVGVGGSGLARITVSAYTSGTANITLRASQIKDPSTLSNGGPNTTVQPITAVQIGGWDSATTTFRAAAVKAASTAVAATDQSLAVALSPNSTLYDGFSNEMLVQNRVQISSTQGVSPVSGLDVGLLNRMLRVGEIGTVRTTSEIQLWQDAFESATINAFWTQSLTTMTAVQATGVLTLNNSAITTVNTDAIITSQRQFPKYPKVSLHARYKANISANVAANHTLVEFGFGAPAGVTAIINNGCFFRVTAAGNLVGVVSYNGTETVSATLLAQGSITTTSYYRWDIFVEDQFARFIVTNSNDIPVVDVQLQIPLTDPAIWAVSHLPTFARVYTDATGGGTAVQLKLAAHNVQILDAQLNMTWDEQSALCMRSSLINPTTYAANPSAMTAAPATLTPANATTGYATLGGEYAFAGVVAIETGAPIFSFQIPSPYSLVLTGIQIPAPMVTVAMALTGVPFIEWFVCINATTNLLSTGGGQRQPLGIQYTTTIGPAIGIVWTTTGSALWQPKVPLVCLPGTWIHIGFKWLVTTAAGTPGVNRGTVSVDGFFM
jgi:hypothetical protein